MSWLKKLWDKFVMIFEYKDSPESDKDVAPYGDPYAQHS